MNWLNVTSRSWLEIAGQAAARNWFDTAYCLATGERGQTDACAIADAVQDDLAWVS
jgi:hypothetical protein